MPAEIVCFQTTCWGIDQSHGSTYVATMKALTPRCGLKDTKFKNCIGESDDRVISYDSERWPRAKLLPEQGLFANARARYKHTVAKLEWSGC